MLSTEKQVIAFKPADGKEKIREGVTNRGVGGLALEARNDRVAKAWIYRYRINGKQFELQLGTYPGMTLAEARQAHREAVKVVEKGLDPRKQRASEKACNLTSWTMQYAFERWIEAYEQTPGRNKQPPTTKTVSQQRGRWRRHLAPRLADFYVRDVTRRLIIEVLEQASQKAKVEARHSLNLLRQLLRYCQKREQIDVNPTDGLTPSDIAASASAPRQRFLSLPELRQLWQAIDDTRADNEGKATTAVLSIPVANALKLLILTGCRRSEVAFMRWDEIKKTEWTIPAERAKSRREHKVHLSPLSLELLAEQRQLAADEFVFTSTQSTGKPIHPDSLSTTIARLQGRARKEHDDRAPLYHLEHFTTHDLRRTFSTQVTEVLMAEPLLVEMMLAHAPPKLMGTYNRAPRWQSQVDVWQRWSEVIATQVPQDFHSKTTGMANYIDTDSEFGTDSNMKDRMKQSANKNHQNSALPTIVTFLDIEASGLKQPYSYPIEIGWVDTLGNSDAFLIRPHPEWSYWDESAESLHGITRQQLMTEGISIQEAVKRLEEKLDVETVFCDALSYDTFWLRRLFQAVKKEPSFQLADIYQLYDGMDTKQIIKMTNLLNKTSVPHRAQADAKRYAEAYCATIND
ncbi:MULTISPECIES: tyrosine-type recombinase/integrase [Halomonas]|uniref:tyrosine-type recombinase/integrase n=1 Tax=Halomonas TaxID=2745 RepID=UPI0018679AAB|nr:tyrosine-type recombinase/integrase [Halomonas colorata]